VEGVGEEEEREATTRPDFPLSLNSLQGTFLPSQTGVRRCSRSRERVREKHDELVETATR
jgi:hypothetical protein